jgi:tRNA A37 threonylcarbamoyladenosine biosynthesis protein TsaE
MVEWPERVGAALPPLDRRITLAYTDTDGIRRLEVA